MAAKAHFGEVSLGPRTGLRIPVAWTYIRSMKNYVDALLDSELPRAVENVGVKLLYVTQEFTKANSQTNSRMFIEYQSAIIRGIEEYGALLRERLGQFQPTHAPLNDADFNKAVRSIDALRDHALALYEKKRESQKLFGGNGLPFEEQRLIAAVASAKNEIAGLQASFRSHRSITRRLVAKVADTLGAQMALAVWTAITFFAGVYLSGPLASVVTWLKHVAP